MLTSSNTSKSRVMPGQVIGSVLKFQPGLGCRVIGDFIHASMAGLVRIEADGADAEALPAISVQHWKQRNAVEKLVPAVGQTVLGRVTRIAANLASVDIKCLEGTTLPHPHLGCIRVEDVFPASVDHTAVNMTNCFRPGDVIKARIMSLGDSKQYYLTTAEVMTSTIMFDFLFITHKHGDQAELGAIWTRAPSGEALVCCFVFSYPVGVLRRNKTFNLVARGVGRDGITCDGSAGHEESSTASIC